MNIDSKLRVETKTKQVFRVCTFFPISTDISTKILLNYPTYSHWANNRYLIVEENRWYSFLFLYFILLIFILIVRTLAAFVAVAHQPLLLLCI